MTPTPTPWQRQPGETSAMFAAFNCYLALVPPRSIDAAFRQRYPEKAHVKGTNGAQKSQANGTWRNWAYGKTAHGQPIPNMPTWAQRAAALDDHLQALQVAEWERLHMSAAEAVARLSQQARGSLADFADVNTPAKLKAHPLAHLVHKMETWAKRTVDGEVLTKVKIELYNSQQALEKVARTHGLFKDKVDVTSGGQPLDELINKAIQAAYGDNDNTDDTPASPE